MLRDFVRIVTRTVGIRLRPYTALHRAVDVLIREMGDVFFIQIGANNGTDYDCFYGIVTEHRLPGIVVEPISEYFDSLQHAYKRYQNVIAVRAAVHPSKDSMSMYRVDPKKATWIGDHGLASFSRQHIVDHGVLETAIVEELVPCLSFGQLLLRVPEDAELGILAIDTEGFDHEILEMLNLSQLHPYIIRFESKHMLQEHLDYHLSRFRAHGYRIVREPEDCLAIDPQVAGRLRYLKTMMQSRYPSKRIRTERHGDKVGDQRKPLK